MASATVLSEPGKCVAVDYYRWESLKILSTSVQIVLFSLCAMNELFFLLVYLHGFGPDTVGSVWLHKWLARLAHAVGPFCAIKHFMNFVQLCSASMVLVRLDDEGDDGEGKHISSRRRCSNSSPRKLK